MASPTPAVCNCTIRHSRRCPMLASSSTGWSQCCDAHGPGIVASPLLSSTHPSHRSNLQPRPRTACGGAGAGAGAGAETQSPPTSAHAAGRGVTDDATTASKSNRRRARVFAIDPGTAWWHTQSALTSVPCVLIVFTLCVTLHVVVVVCGHASLWRCCAAVITSLCVCLCVRCVLCVRWCTALPPALCAPCSSSPGIRCFACVFDSHGRIHKFGVGVYKNLHRLDASISAMQATLDQRLCRRRNRRRIMAAMTRLHDRCAAIIDALHHCLIRFLLGDDDDSNEIR